MKKLLGITLCLFLTMFATSCKDSPNAEDLWEKATYTENTQLGEGEKTLLLEVLAGEKSVLFTVLSDCATVGEALTGCDLISGEEGPYGLYIKTVNGITADYDINQSYWAITKGGEYMSTGVDSTEFADGDKFELTYTK